MSVTELFLKIDGARVKNLLNDQLNISEINIPLNFDLSSIQCIFTWFLRKIPLVFKNRDMFYGIEVYWY